MQQIIPFNKELEFKTMVTKITGISLEHTLRLEDDYTIKGDLLIDGTYSRTEASSIEEPFNYKLPIEISIDEKYNTKKITIDIDDFNYKIIDNEKLSIKVDLLIDNLEEKEELEEISNFEIYDEIASPNEIVYNREENNDEDLFLETDLKQDLSIEEDIEEKESMIYQEKEMKEEKNVEKKEEITNDISNGVESIFSAFSNTEETYKTYCIYIVRENDTIETILSKYKISKETLEEYNNLSDIKLGSKVIIPDYKNE